MVTTLHRLASPTAVQDGGTLPRMRHDSIYYMHETRRRILPDPILY
jgi:hypothetical protein